MADTAQVATAASSKDPTVGLPRGSLAAGPRRTARGPAGAERPRARLDLGADRATAGRDPAGSAQEVRERPRAAPAEGLTCSNGSPRTHAWSSSSAQEEATRLHHGRIGTEHLLLALLDGGTPRRPPSSRGTGSPARPSRRPSSATSASGDLDARGAHHAGHRPRRRPVDGGGLVRAGRARRRRRRAAAPSGPATSRSAPGRRRCSSCRCARRSPSSPESDLRRPHRPRAAPRGRGTGGEGAARPRRRPRGPAPRHHRGAAGLTRLIGWTAVSARQEQQRRDGGQARGDRGAGEDGVQLGEDRRVGGGVVGRAVGRRVRAELERRADRARPRR